MNRPELLYQVDAFAHEPFSGNPAAVCLLESDDPRASDSRWMQALAREMNLSETAFVVGSSEDSGGYSLRWFTPLCEVDLCGHAAVAAPHCLWEAVIASSDQAPYFRTRSGVLTARSEEWGITLDFPATPVCDELPATSKVVEALHLVDKPRFVGSNGVDCLIELETESKVKALRPDFAGLAEADFRGVVVTARADGSIQGQDVDFVSRFFAPSAGIDEDPVTGSAHCTLAPYWGGKLDKQELVGFQCSSRGGLCVHTAARATRVTGG
ncbi:MAG: PhzF family phenazine biosynthesis protein [bacterium]